MFGGLGMEVVYVNCIYVTSARSRHVALLDAQELGKEAGFFLQNLQKESAL